MVRQTRGSLQGRNYQDYGALMSEFVSAKNSCIARRPAFVDGLLGACVFGSALLWPMSVATGAANSPAGTPDFSSGNAGWAAPIRAQFIAVPGSPSPIGDDPAHPPYREGGRTYRISDLSNPNLKQWVKDVMKKDNDEVLAGKIAYTARASCSPAGVPGFMMFSVHPVFFLQTRREVTMIYEGDHQVRHIYMDVPHSPNPKLSWYGESVGHYEGDTLVIDTIGLSTKTFIDNYRTPHTEKLHVVERWKIIDDGKTMEATMTIDDPETFNQPWQAAQRYEHVQQRLIEDVCAENDQQIFDYHIPIAEKPDF
jgi:hypothetical protein